MVGFLNEVKLGRGSSMLGTRGLEVVLLPNHLAGLVKNEDIPEGDPARGKDCIEGEFKLLDDDVVGMVPFRGAIMWCDERN